MEDLTSIFAGLESVVLSFEDSFATNILRVAKRIFASVRACLHREVTPQRFERFERRLECLFRELARQLLERTVNQIETSRRPQPVTWEHRVFRPYARRERSMETRVGTIRYRRWLYRNEYSFFVPGIAPLDKRLGLTGDRVSPGVAHKLGRLAADLPQQVAINELHEHCGVRLSVDAYRKVVEHVAQEVRFRHDDAAMDQLRQWRDQVAKTAGKHSNSRLN